MLPAEVIHHISIFTDPITLINLSLSSKDNYYLSEKLRKVIKNITAVKIKTVYPRDDRTRLMQGVFDYRYDFSAQSVEELYGELVPLGYNRSLGHLRVVIGRGSICASRVWLGKNEIINFTRNSNIKDDELEFLYIADSTVISKIIKYKKLRRLR